MATKILIALSVMLAVAAAVPPNWGWGAAGAPQNSWAPAPGAANPWIPPWVSSAPWYPQWVPCATVGADCLDCNTKVVCTKVGGIQKACSDPALPYCNLGECSATPAAGCEPTTEAA